MRKYKGKRLFFSFHRKRKKKHKSMKKIFNRYIQKLNKGKMNAESQNGYN